MKHESPIAFTSERMQRSGEASKTVWAHMYLNEDRDAPSKSAARLHVEIYLSHPLPIFRGKSSAIVAAYASCSHDAQSQKQGNSGSLVQLEDREFAAMRRRHECSIIRPCMKQEQQRAGLWLLL